MRDKATSRREEAGQRLPSNVPMRSGCASRCCRLGRIGDDMAREPLKAASGQIWTEFDLVWAKLGRLWAKFRPNLTKHLPNLVVFGKTWAGPGLIWQNLTLFGPISKKCHRCWAILGHVRPSLGDAAKCCRCQADLDPGRRLEGRLSVQPLRRLQRPGQQPRRRPTRAGRGRHPSHV